MFCFGVFLATPTIASAVEKIISSITGQSVATIIAALIGFSGVMITTRAGFRNLIASQEAQAKRDREDREHKDELQKQAKQDERLYTKRVLISSLQAELSMLLDQVHGQRAILYTQMKVMEHAKDDRFLNKQEVAMVVPRYNTPLYDANINNLGLLGFNLAADVVKIYSGTKLNPDNSKVTPGVAFALYDAMYKYYSNWGGEIVHVIARLNSALGYCDDPGNLYEFRKKRDASKKTMHPPLYRPPFNPAPASSSSP